MSMDETKPTPIDAEPNEAVAEAPPVRTVADVEAELAQTKDSLLRALAESENARRRAEREAAEGRVYAIDRFARDLLTIADHLGRALDALTPEMKLSTDESMRTVLDGVAMTETAMFEVFGRHGLKRVGQKGDKFDPNLHQAVTQIPSDAPAGAIADVFQSGYVLGDRTLRAAMVAVSLGNAANEAKRDDSAGGVDIKV